MNALGQTALRLIALVACVFAIAATSRVGTNLDWTAPFLIAGVVGPILFVWLLGQQALADTKWSTFISWREPFFPMRRYPYRYWVFSGESTTLGGVVSIFIDSQTKGGYIAYGATFFLLGLAMIVASVLAFKRKIERS